MSRLKNLIAAGAVAFGLVAAASGPALADPASTPSSEQQLVQSLEENRHISVEPTENRHES